MENVFIDTDVIVDFLTDRKPFSLESAKIFSLIDQKKIIFRIQDFQKNAVDGFRLVHALKIGFIYIFLFENIHEIPVTIGGCRFAV